MACDKFYQNTRRYWVLKMYRNKRQALSKSKQPVKWLKLKRQNIKTNMLARSVSYFDSRMPKNDFRQLHHITWNPNFEIHWNGNFDSYIDLTKRNIFSQSSACRKKRAKHFFGMKISSVGWRGGGSILCQVTPVKIEFSSKEKKAECNSRNKRDTSWNDKYRLW